MFSLAVGALASVVAAGTAVAVLAGLWVGVLVMVCGPAMETAPNDTMQVGLYITVLGGSLMAIGAGIMFPGRIAGIVTAAVGRLGENQNPSACGLFAGIATATSVAVCLGVVMPVLVSTLSVGQGVASILAMAFGSGWLAWTVLGFLCFTGFFIGLIEGASRAGQTRICPSCHLFAGIIRLPRISFRSATQLVEAMDAGDVSTAVEHLFTRGGGEITAKLHECKKCGRGVLEARVKRRAATFGPVDSDGEKPQAPIEMRVLIGSWALTPEQVKRIKASR